MTSRTTRAWRALRSRAQSQRRVAAVLGTLRRNWLVAIGVASLVGLVIVVNPLRLAAILRTAEPRVLALMVPTVLAVHVLRGVAWWVALRHLGVRVSVFRSVYIMFAGRLLVFMPTGDLARVAMLEDTGASGRNPGTIAGSITFQELSIQSRINR